MSEGSDAVAIGRRLEEILKSHCDTPVTDLLSGSDPIWACQARIEDLREEIDQLRIQEEANYDLSKENAKLKATIVTWTEDVPREEQIEIIRQQIRNGEI